MLPVFVAGPVQDRVYYNRGPFLEGFDVSLVNDILYPIACGRRYYRPNDQTDYLGYEDVLASTLGGILASNFKVPELRAPWCMLGSKSWKAPVSR